MRLFRRDRPPESLRRAVLDRLAPGERPLAWGSGPDGTALATDLGLWWPTGPAGEPLGWERMGWERVDRAVWREGVLQVTAAGEAGPRRLRLARPRSLPQAVRDRVTASIVINQHHRLTPAGGVRVLARRRPQDGALTWSLAFDRGVPADDPALRREAERLLAEARRAIGEPA